MTDEDREDCQRFKSLLSEVQLTQMDAGNILGISQGMIAFYVRGERRITMEIATTLANHLGVPVGRISPRFQSMIDRSVKVNRKLEALWDEATEAQRDLILSIAETVTKSR